MKLCRKQICENAQAYISGNQVKFLNSSAAVYREAVSIMPLEEATFSRPNPGRRVLLLICESEDRFTGRVKIVVARTTDY